MAKRSSNELSKKNFLKEWLEKLQQESWQLELLISGFALFGIYESRTLVDDFSLYVSAFSYSNFNVINTFFTILLQGGWLIFFINLLTHVILRGLWIGAIGLRYVSEDIEYDQLGYSERFTSYLKRKVGEYDDFIERLEKICSVLFAYTFLLFLLLMSMILFFLGFVLLSIINDLISGRGQEPNGFIVVLNLAYAALGLMVFIDFITLGSFKKITEPSVNKVYMYIYRFYSTITLSFLYRPLLYNFIDNRYTRRLFFLSIPYIFIVVFNNKLFNLEAFPHWNSDLADEYGLYVSKMTYEDERMKWYDENDLKQNLNKHTLPRVTLSQFKVDQTYLEIFITMFGNDQFILSELEGLDPLFKPGFRFSLFSNDEHQDTTFTNMEKQRSDLTRPLRNERKELRRQIRKKSTPILRNKIDSLEGKIEDIRSEWSTRINEHNEEKLEKIIGIMLDYTSLVVDSKDIRPELDCFFYQHPNFGEKGILCMYNTDSLTYGKHELSVERQVFNSHERSTNVRDFVIPFYKIQ